MGCKVLVVDDSRVVRSFYRKALDLSALPIEQVLEAVDGINAYALLKEHNFDLIFLDLNMPEMGGLELLQRCRDEHLTSNVPIVIISAHAASDDLEMLSELGVAEAHRKPITPEEVIATAGRFLTLKRGAHD